MEKSGECYIFVGKTQAKNNWVNKKEKLIGPENRILLNSSSLSSLVSSDCFDFLLNRHKAFQNSLFSLEFADSKDFVQFSSLQLTF